MPHVQFLFDREKDIWTHWASVHYASPWTDVQAKIPSFVIEAVKDKSLTEAGPEIERIHSRFYNSGLIEVFTSAMNEAWQKIEPEFFRRLETITQKPFPHTSVAGYVTTSTFCPYSKDESPFFMVSFHTSFLDGLRTAGHELFHLHFHAHFFSDVAAQIGEGKARDLKEALTVLHNLEFKDLWFVKDKGYSPHTALRSFIEAEWKKKVSFPNLIHSCITYLSNDEH